MSEKNMVHEKVAPTHSEYLQGFSVEKIVYMWDKLLG
jgi:hypothetical protein